MFCAGNWSKMNLNARRRSHRRGKDLPLRGNCARTVRVVSDGKDFGFDLSRRSRFSTPNLAVDGSVFRLAVSSRWLGATADVFHVSVLQLVASRWPLVTSYMACHLLV
jgi:hypothetical protein